MNELTKRILTSLVLIIILTSMFIYDYIFISSLLIIACIIWVELNSMFIKIFKNYYYKILVNFLSLIYIFYFIWISINSLHLYDTKVIWMYSILICIMSDIGGFIFGKTFKGPKLTKISPNKTLSGMIGAFVFSLLLMLIYHFIIDNSNFIKSLIITLFISIISQLGDIFISYIKRKAKVKNSSNILPGHGGLLDRFDGIIFGVPAGLNCAFII